MDKAVAVIRNGRIMSLKLLYVKKLDEEQRNHAASALEEADEIIRR